MWRGAKASLPAFELFTFKFPKSANAWNGLAQIWQLAGNKQKALECYQVVLTIAPDLHHAKKQIAVLSQ